MQPKGIVVALNQLPNPISVFIMLGRATHGGGDSGVGSVDMQSKF